MKCRCMKRAGQLLSVKNSKNKFFLTVRCPSVSFWTLLAEISRKNQKASNLHARQKDLNKCENTDLSCF